MSCLSVLFVCPVSLTCLSVTLVYCGQTVGWIKIPLGTEVGLGPGDIVLDGNSAYPRKGTQHPSLFGPCLLWLNGRPSQQLLSSSDRLPQAPRHFSNSFSVMSSVKSIWPSVHGSPSPSGDIIVARFLRLR